VFRFVEQEKASNPVSVTCRVLGVSPSGFYAWQRRPPSARAQRDDELSVHISGIHKRSRGTYGVPRVHFELAADHGVSCSRKRVARLMRALQLQGVHRRKYVRTTRRDETLAPAPDLVRRNFNPHGPNELWVGDITYVPTWSGFLYLAVIVDAFTRRVVGWRMADTLHTEVVLEALEMALHNRKPKDVIHHSDRGSQYTSMAFGRRCREAGVIPSMGSVGDAYDNAMAESFFATLEKELIARSSWKNRTEARLAVFDYIEGFYNPHRRHSSLSMLSPAEFERRLLHSSAA
jgi:putative transposase